MLNLRAWLGGGTAALAGFVLLAFTITVMGGRDPLDAAVTADVIGLRTPVLTAVAQTATFLGSATFLVPLTVILVALVWLRHRHWEPALILAGLAWFSLTGVATLKDLLGRARPPAADELGAVASDPSLPSGHTTMSTVVYLLAAVLLSLGARVAVRRAALLAAAIMVVLVGASRIYLGYHWLSDVVAGWLLGLFVVAIGAYLLGRWLPVPPSIEPAREPIHIGLAACVRAGGRESGSA